MSRAPYCLASARVLASGRSTDKCTRTAGQTARANAPLEVKPLRMVRLRRWLGRMGR